MALGGETLSEGTDYTVGYANNVNVGAANISVRCRGAYKGVVNVTFTIIKARIEVPSSTTGLVYDGSSQMGVPEGKGYTLSGTYAAIDAGTYVATAVIDDGSNYMWADGTTGEKAITWSIAPASIAGATVTAPTVAYDGTALEPEVTVSLINAGGDIALLVEDDDGAGDYNFSIERNLVAGWTYYLSCGSYSGSASYTVGVSRLGGADESGSNSLPSSWTDLSEGTPVAVSTGSWLRFTPSTDGTYTFWSSDEGDGEPRAWLYEVSSTNGLLRDVADNDDGGDGLNFWIEERLVAGHTYFLKCSSYGDGIASYTVQVASQETPSVTVPAPNKYVDIRVGSSANVTSGDWVRFTPTTSGIYRFQSSNESGDPYGMLYTILPVKFKADIDYVVTSYSNNVEPGTGMVTIEGIGNYTGSATGTFIVDWPFRDVSARTSHYDDILWLYSTGITTGYGSYPNATYRGMSGVKRQDMAAFLFRLAVRMGVADPDWEPSEADTEYFSDVNSKTPHAREVWWLASSGVSAGWTMKDGSHEFRGMNTVVRQDMAAFLHRMYDKGLAKTS